MQLANFANSVGRRFIRHKNPRVVCPPGEMKPGTKQLILVPTIMRSGTHLLIDTLINNFPEYKRLPLYVDLDSLLKHASTERQRVLVKRLIECSGYVVKTHYPQNVIFPEWETHINSLASTAKIIRVVRPSEETFHSSQAWDLPEFSRGNYMDTVERFNKLWERFECLVISYNEMTDRDKYPDLLAKIGKHIGTDPRKRTIYPPRKEDRVSVYFFKSLTRILGRHSPIVNTTINFNRSANKARTKANLYI